MPRLSRSNMAVRKVLAAAGANSAAGPAGSSTPPGASTGAAAQSTPAGGPALRSPHTTQDPDVVSALALYNKMFPAEAGSSGSGAGTATAIETSLELPGGTGSAGGVTRPSTGGGSSGVAKISVGSVTGRQAAPSSQAIDPRAAFAAFAAADGDDDDDDDRGAVLCDRDEEITSVAAAVTPVKAAPAYAESPRASPRVAAGSPLVMLKPKLPTSNLAGAGVASPGGPKTPPPGPKTPAASTTSPAVAPRATPTAASRIPTPPSAAKTTTPGITAPLGKVTTPTGAIASRVSAGGSAAGALSPLSKGPPPGTLATGSKLSPKLAPPATAAAGSPATAAVSTSRLGQRPISSSGKR